MIDFHNHILPNIDDGSKSLNMSIEMLTEARAQGITDVVNTVHFQHPKFEGKEISFKLIRNKISMLENELKKRRIPIKIHIGAEVFYLPNLLSLKDEPLATFGHGKYMLIEFQTNFIPDKHRETLFNLKMKGVTPIIAHPERYHSVQKDINLVYDWLNAGCIIQVDAGSLLGLMGKSAQEASHIILKQHWCQVIGSDAHDNKKRNFVLNDGLNISKKLVGNVARNYVDNYPKAIIEGKPIKIEAVERFKTPKKYFWNL